MNQTIHSYIPPVQEPLLSRNKPFSYHCNDIIRDQADERNVLQILQDHDCLLTILGFLSWDDLNAFSSVSKHCQVARGHPSLDQTRSGTISLGKGVRNIQELMEKAKRHHWSDAFCGQRTHLRLTGLTYLSSNIDPVTQEFVDSLAPLKEVESLDCSIVLPNERIHTSTGRPWFLAPYEDYVDKGFAQGLTISLLVPNLREIDMSRLPLTLLGVAWLAENNPKLRVLRWNRSLIWPVSNNVAAHVEAMKNLHEIHLDHATIIVCADLDQDFLWSALLQYGTQLTHLSLRGTRYYLKGKLSPLPQSFLVRLVLSLPNLKRFSSDLLPEHKEQLRKNRPDLMFC